LKAVVFYQPGSSNMDQIMAVYPRHKALVDLFAARGEALAIGTFAGGREGSMGVFTTRESAESFVRQDPFVQEGLVGGYTIRDWDEILMG
jgi:uncharacterized protein